MSSFSKSGSCLDNAGEISSPRRSVISSVDLLGSDILEEAGFPGSKIIVADGENIYTGPYNRQMGLALPNDYDGSDPGSRAIFLYVNGLMMPMGVMGGWVIRSDNYALSPVCGPSGDPMLASMEGTGRVLVMISVSGPA